MINIGLLYKQGMGRSIDLKESVKYFKKAADLGDPLAMVLYAEALYNGQGIKTNQNEAIKYFKMSIENGNAIAMRCYGEILIAKDKNSIEGFNYIKMAADNGDVDAMAKVGDILFDKPNATEDDYDESFKYYKMAYLKGNQISMILILELIKRRRLSSRNIYERVKFIKEKADGIDVEAMKA